MDYTSHNLQYTSMSRYTKTFRLLYKHLRNSQDLQYKKTKLLLTYSLEYEFYEGI